MHNFFRWFLGSIEKGMHTDFFFAIKYKKFGSYLTGNTSSLRNMTNRLMLFKEPVAYCKLYETLLRSVVRM
jgi:hypothetical protein